MGQHYGPASDQATVFKAVQEPMEMLGVVLFIHANLLYLRDYVGVKSLGFTVTADVEPARRMEPLAATPGQT
jgi:hypothetical protein